MKRCSWSAEYTQKRHLWPLLFNTCINDQDWNFHFITASIPGCRRVSEFCYLECCLIGWNFLRKWNYLSQKKFSNISSISIARNSQFIFESKKNSKGSLIILYFWLSHPSATKFILTRPLSSKHFKGFSIPFLCPHSKYMSLPWSTHSWILVDFSYSQLEVP